MEKIWVTEVAEIGTVDRNGCKRNHSLCSIATSNNAFTNEAWETLKSTDNSQSANCWEYVYTRLKFKVVVYE